MAGLHEDIVAVLIMSVLSWYGHMMREKEEVVIRIVLEVEESGTWVVLVMYRKDACVCKQQIALQ